MTLPSPPRKQWFLDRIGTEVWRSAATLDDGSKCNCNYCKEILEKPILLSNEYQALALYNLELHYDDIICFSTKTERDEHARTNQT